MFGNGFPSFEEDPFFRDHHERMRETFGMFNNFHRHFDPFMDPLALPSPPQRDRDRNRRDQYDDQRDDRDRRERREVAPTDMFGGMFGINMNSMLRNMGQQFERAANDPNSYSYSQSSVMSYSSDGRGEPKYFQAHKSTKKAPGEIRETQHAVRDSETGLHRMAIGHHIGDRGQVIERSMNRRTGEEERKQDFINIEEEDVQRFNQEWEEKARSRTHALGPGNRQRERPRHRAIEEPVRRRHENHRDRGERERERDREREGHREEGGRTRRVRVQSRPVNRHAPRSYLD